MASDLFPLLAGKPEGMELIVRAAQDRRLAEGGRLFAALEAAAVLGHSKVRVAPRGPGEKERIATVALRAGRVSLARPQNGRVEDLPDRVDLTLVEACEIDTPAGVTPLLWRLLTSHAATSFEQAAAVVQQYRLRWRIEQTFRALKSEPNSSNAIALPLVGEGRG